ncbi:MAG: ABC transporter permease [Chloroflexi bacterium]|nr:ABC transporter permease [Chloroflexota bacterium]
MASQTLTVSTAGHMWKAQRYLRELRLPWTTLLVLAVLVGCAAFAPWLAPHDPRDIEISERRLAPGQAGHLLGTDMMGRDMLSRLIYGARTSAFISLVALGTGAAFGTALGVVSGYIGGKLDAVIMRVSDAVMGFPTILVALIIVVVMGGAGIMNVIIAIAATVWARFARQVRGEVLAVKERDFVTMAVIANVPATVIMWRHIFPNVANTVLIVIGLLVGQTILLEASLSFLGLGLPPGAPAWGIMVAEGRDVLITVWWLSLAPGVAITVVVLAMNLFGDWLRDTLDPKLKRI